MCILSQQVELISEYFNEKNNRFLCWTETLEWAKKKKKAVWKRKNNTIKSKFCCYFIFLFFLYLLTTLEFLVAEVIVLLEFQHPWIVLFSLPCLSEIPQTTTFTGLGPEKKLLLRCVWGFRTGKTTRWKIVFNGKTYLGLLSLRTWRFFSLKASEDIKIIILNSSG